jgi:polar amino acid transport system permease protein
MTYHINYNFVWQYFDKFYWGLLLGIELALISILFGAVFGLGLALVHVDGPRWARRLVSAYVEFIRNQPLLLLVYLVFTASPASAASNTARPLLHHHAVDLFGGLLVEIFRSGLDAVPRGVVEAGKAIGLTPLQRLIHVRLPTMLRITMPALGNQFVSLFKDTSVAFVIAVPELTYAAKWLATNKFRIFEGYSILAPMYLVTCYAIFAIFRLLERRFTIRR